MTQERRTHDTRKNFSPAYSFSELHSVRVNGAASKRFRLRTLQSRRYGDRKEAVG